MLMTCGFAQKGARMLSTRTKDRLMGLTVALLLSACAGATVIGAGCRIYAEARRDMPVEAISMTSVEVAGWIDSLDFAMTKACTGG